MIELWADKDDIQEIIGTLKVLPKGLEKAGARAINKTLTSTRTFMVKEIREDYAIKAGAVRSQLKIQKANWNNLHGTIYGAASPGIPLIEFARTKKVPSTTRLKSGAYRPLTGIPVVVRKSKGRIAASGVFLAKMKSGHVGAFKRTGGIYPDGRAQIKEAYGPSPIKILGSDIYDERIEDFADETLQKNFHHEADFLLRKMGLR